MQRKQHSSPGRNCDEVDTITTAMRRDMRYAEAQEYGLIPDDATDAKIISDGVLVELGLTAEEVGQDLL